MVLEQKINYHCESCNYNCKNISHWNQHIDTNRHKNNGIIKRNKIKHNKVFECSSCRFSSKQHSNYKLHYLTKHGTKEEKQKQFSFYCEKCNFGTFGKINYERHLETQKHINSNT